MSTSSEIETLVLLRYGRPDFSANNLRRRSDYLGNLPELFIIEYGYVVRELDGRWQALEKCISVTEEQLFKELIEFHMRLFTN